MTELFLKIVNMSFSACWLVLAVLAARFLLKKAPKWVAVALWGLVAVRLLCPFSLESALSLIPSAEVVSPQIMADPQPTIHTGIDPINLVVNEALAESFTPNPGDSANPLQIWIPILSVVWILGMAAMGEYTLFTWLQLRKKVSMAIRVTENVYLSEHIPSPFVLGIFRPRIYLPYGMTERDMRHVIAHERTHIRRRDHWWKPLGFALLSIHWFNPLLWLAYVLLCRDIELACDEKVIQELGMDARADYSQALLNCSISHRSIAACPVAFGEIGVKQRVKNVLTYRRPAFWVIAVSLVLCILVAVCFLTDPKDDFPLQIVNQEGYRILFQTDTDIVFSLYKPRLPDSIYSVEGHTFRGKQADIYHMGSSIYLKHIGYADEAGEFIRLTYGMDHQPEGNVILLPYSVITENGVTAYAQSSVFARNSAVTADKEQLDGVCKAASDVTSGDITVTIRRDAWDAAENELHFTVDGFQRLFFTRESVFTEVTPWHITQELMPGDVDFAQATFWNDETTHLLLDEGQIRSLLQIFSQLSPNTFAHGTHPTHSLSLMLNCGQRALLLKTDGTTVWFTFDSETAANMDGEWMTQDPELAGFLTRLYYQTSPDSFYGVSLKIEEVYPGGATVVFTGTGEKPAGRLLGGNDYWLQAEEDGIWQDVAKTPEPSFTTNNYDIDNIRRHKIDWLWLYGVLPSGHYRIGKTVTYQEGTKPLESATVWAEFTLTDPAYDAHAILSNLIPDNARAEAVFASGGGYTCFPQEAQELVGLLNSIKKEELVVSPAMNPTISMTVYANEQVTLHYNGVYVQFAFNGSANSTPWAVKNQKLNTFFEMLPSHSPENSTYEIYNVAPLEDLTDAYTIEEAMIDKVVVMVDRDVSANQEVWTEFVNTAAQGLPATVRILFYNAPREGSPGNKIFYDLEYDSEGYHLISYTNGIRNVFDYPYLRYFAGELGEDVGYVHSFECYVLTDNATDPWEKLNRSYGDHRTIYQNLIYVPKQMNLPWVETIELRLNGQVLRTLSGAQQTLDLHELLYNATYLGYTPKTYFLGPELALISEYSGTYTLQLDLDSDLLLYNGYFYDYGPGTNSNGGINNLPVLLGMLGLKDWPEEVKAAYPNYFSETGSVVAPPANDLFSDRGGKMIGVWYPDWSYLEILPAQADRLLEALKQEAPNPTDHPMPDTPDTVFTVHIGFDGGREFDLAYMGQTDFFLRDFQTNQVYQFSSEALRMAVDSAISETKAALYS